MSFLLAIIDKLIDKTIGLRVSKEKVLEVLNATEPGGNAYPDFLQPLIMERSAQPVVQVARL